MARFPLSNKACQNESKRKEGRQQASNRELWSGGDWGARIASGVPVRLQPDPISEYRELQLS